MSPDEVRQTGDRLPVVEGVDPTTAANADGYLAVSGLVAIPISHVNASVQCDEDLEFVDESGTQLGTICFSRRLVDADPNTLTRWQYIAYLADAPVTGAGQLHTFQSNYLVLDEPFLGEYVRKYMESAPLWGQFSHAAMPSLVMQPPRRSVAAYPSLLIPTEYHKQAFSRYVQSRNAFDRFLKLYHCLELLFDYVILKRMRAVGDDLSGFGKIISSYGSNETDRLKFLLSNYCDEKMELFLRFYALSHYEARATEIFQTHSKTGNPIADDVSWQKFLKLCREEQLTPARLKAEKLASDESGRDKLAVNLAAYCIYRVRSSIAHSKVGEFLFLDSDEEFIVMFAEPLLMEVVTQVFSNQPLQAVLLG